MPRFALLALCLALPAVAGGPAAGAAATRDQVRVVGSSTAFPYTQAVAEEFADETGQLSPVVEATGTGGGMRLFCSGVGPRTPDVIAASRRILPSELAACQRNGVTDLIGARFADDAVIIAQSRQAPWTDFTRAQIFQAVAASVEIAGEIVPNPYRNWHQIDPSLPDAAIEIIGPPLTSGTRDAFVKLVLNQGCLTFPAIEALPEPQRADVCSRIRRDGVFVVATESDNVLVRQLAADPGAIGIFGYTMLHDNADWLRGAALDGVAPTREAIISGAYGAVRSLYLYVKNAHRGVIPGLDGFLAEYSSEAAIGPNGYLVQLGLIPLATADRESLRAAVGGGAPPPRD